MLLKFNESRFGRALFAALLPVVLNTAACKKPAPPPPPPPPPPPVEVHLQVSSVSPSSLNINQAAAGKVFGAGFATGATVQFIGPAGTVDGSRVSVVDSNTIGLLMPQIPTPGGYDVKVTNPDGESATLRGGLTINNAGLTCKHVVVNFDFDRSDVRSDAQRTLDGNMSCWQGAAGAIKIEGHADERGTTEYNLALGQRRADSVRSYLSRAGVSGGRIQTVSYGEERPVASGHDESAWAQNRRDEINAFE